MNAVGIDVACKTLVVIVSVDGKPRQAKTFNNIPAGHKDIISLLCKLKGDIRVCMEATGMHHFDLAVALSREERIKVMVINPKAAHNFWKALMQRNKTDSLDAGVLAEYCERMPFVAWQRPAEEKLSLRTIARRINATNKIKTQTKNQLAALRTTLETPEIVIQTTEQLVLLLEQQIEQYRTAATQLVQGHEALSKAYSLIIGIKGIANASAIQIMGELMALPDGLNVKQWVAYAGLDPRHFESGSSILKKPRLSKAGNKYIRQALYMPALVAARSEPNIKAYYLHLIEDNGLKKLQALCAVMRKLLHAIYGVLKNQEVFDGQKFYVLVAQKAG